MSWSFYGVGKPAALKAAIDKELSNYGTGQSADEFAAAAPHLKGLLDCADENAAVSVSATGHASFSNGVKTYQQINADIKQLGQLYV